MHLQAICPASESLPATEEKRLLGTLALNVPLHKNLLKILRVKPCIIHDR